MKLDMGDKAEGERVGTAWAAGWPSGRLGAGSEAERASGRHTFKKKKKEREAQKGGRVSG